jgi:DNA recombination protein RmuC
MMTERNQWENQLRQSTTEKESIRTEKDALAIQLSKKDNVLKPSSPSSIP